MPLSSTAPIPPYALRVRRWNMLAGGAFVVGVFAAIMGVEPAWACTAAAILCVVFVLIGASQSNRVARWVDAHDCQVCLTCGYDLRASPEKGKCPECGVNYVRHEVRAEWLRWLRPATHATIPSPAHPPHAQRLQRVMWWGGLGLPIGLVVSIATEDGAWLAFGLIGGFLFAMAAMAFKSSRLMAAAARADHRLCTHCGYSMVGVSEPGKCPECGKFYDPTTARSQWRSWCMERP